MARNTTESKSEGYDAQDAASEAEFDTGGFDFSADSINDFVIELPKLTMATIDAQPERGKRGPIKLCTISGVASGIEIRQSLDGQQHFEALTGEFGAVVFDDKGEPAKFYKSGVGFLPGGMHQSAVAALNRAVSDSGGKLAFVHEYWAEPSKSPAGYRYYAKNLNKIDRENMPLIHKLMAMSVRRSAEIAAAKPELLTQQAAE